MYKARYIKMFEAFTGEFSKFRIMWSSITDYLRISEELDLESCKDILNTITNNGTYFIINPIINDFSKQNLATIDECVEVIESILDVDLGILSKESLNNFKDIMVSKFDKNPNVLAIIFYLDKMRDILCDEMGYDKEEETHLKNLRGILDNAKDDIARYTLFNRWLTTSFVTAMNSAISTIAVEDAYDFLKERGIELESKYEIGDLVIFLLKGFSKSDWENLSPEHQRDYTSAPANEVVGFGKIIKIENGEYTIDNGDLNKVLFKNVIKEINQDNLNKMLLNLEEIKDDAYKLNIMAKIADMMNDESKKAEIEKLINADDK